MANIPLLPVGRNLDRIHPAPFVCMYGRNHSSLNGRHPKDEAVRSQVRQLLDTLAGNPENGIERIVPAAEISKDGGFPGAAFLVALKVGYETAYAVTPPLITKPANLGMHGYMPERPEMRSSFFIVGPHVAKGHSVGEIDMRQIAPTLAAVLSLRLPAAEMTALPLAK